LLSILHITDASIQYGQEHRENSLWNREQHDRCPTDLLQAKVWTVRYWATPEITFCSRRKVLQLGKFGPRFFGLTAETPNSRMCIHSLYGLILTLVLTFPIVLDNLFECTFPFINTNELFPFPSTLHAQQNACAEKRFSEANFRWSSEKARSSHQEKGTTKPEHVDFRSPFRLRLWPISDYLNRFWS